MYKVEKGEGGQEKRMEIEGEMKKINYVVYLSLNAAYCYVFISERLSF